MRGKIKIFFKDKGYGFIYTQESAEDIFFHISQVKSGNNIERGDIADFDFEKTPRGLIAKNIYISKEKNPRFICFGDIRIKISNIKNYGIIEWEESYEYEFSEEELKLRRQQYRENTSAYKKIYQTVFNVIGIIQTLQGEDSAYMDIPKTETRYKKYRKLYVTTYQNDNFEFIDRYVSFDLDEKIKELDKYCI